MDLLANPEQADLCDQSSSSDGPSDSTSSASLPEDSKLTFEGSKPLVLELHDMTRDKQPGIETGATKKKLRKKKKKEQKTKHVSSSSPSDTSLQQPKSDTNKEEFYDAHESYHGIPPHQQATPAGLQQIVAPKLKETPLASVMVDPVAPTPGGVVIHSSTDQTGALKRAAVPQTVSDPVSPTKTAITKPTEH